MPVGVAHGTSARPCACSPHARSDVQAAPGRACHACRGLLGDTPDISKAMRLLTSCKKLTRTGRGGRTTPFFYMVLPLRTLNASPAAHLPTELQAAVRTGRERRTTPFFFGVHSCCSSALLALPCLASATLHIIVMVVSCRPGAACGPVQALLGPLTVQRLSAAADPPRCAGPVAGQPAGERGGPKPARQRAQRSISTLWASISGDRFPLACSVSHASAQQVRLPALRTAQHQAVPLQQP